MIKNLHTYLSRVAKALLAAMVLVAGCLSAGAKSNIAICDAGRVPSVVSDKLKKSFPEWRIKTLDDFSSYDRNLWIKANPGMCPGLVSGFIQSGSSKGYVFLLVSKTKKNGYKLVFFLKGTKGVNYDLVTIAEDNISIIGSSGIRLVKPGTYSDAEESEKIKLKHDGIMLEAIEAGSIIYYWSKGKFRQLLTSE